MKHADKYFARRRKPGKDVHSPILRYAVHEANDTREDLYAQLLDEERNAFDKHAEEERVEVFRCDGLRVSRER